MAENDANFKLHIDEGDNKDSPGREQTQPDVRHDVNYPDIKMQRLYESKNGPLAQAQDSKFTTKVRNSRQSLPKVVGSLTHSI